MGLVKSFLPSTMPRQEEYEAAIELLGGEHCEFIDW
jgi:hypothetical protein